jgi:hypothetical protein
MNPRRPTADDYNRLRRLHDAAGSREELNRWIDDAVRQGKQRRGPKRYKNRLTIGMYQRLFEADAKDRTEIIKQLVRDGVIPGRGTPESKAERVRRELRKGQKDLEQTMRRFEDQFRRRYPDLFRGMK